MGLLTMHQVQAPRPCVCSSTQIFSKLLEQQPKDVFLLTKFLGQARLEESRELEEPLPQGLSRNM